MFNVTNWLLGQALVGAPDGPRSNAYIPDAKRIPTQGERP
jgi:hypothetical protein